MSIYLKSSEITPPGQAILQITNNLQSKIHWTLAQLTVRVTHTLSSAIPRGPQLSQGPASGEPGDKVNVSCSLVGSLPAPSITWSVETQRNITAYSS